MQHFFYFHLLFSWKFSPGINSTSSRYSSCRATLLHREKQQYSCNICVVAHIHTHVDKSSLWYKNTRMHKYGHTLTHAWIRTHTHTHTHTHCPSVFVSLPLPSPWVCLQKNVMLCTTRMLSAPHTEHFPWNHHMHCRFLCIMNIWNPSGEGKVSRWVHDPRNWSTNKNIRVYLAGNIEIHLVLLCQPPKLDQEAGCSRLQLARWGITVNCIREGHLRFDSETLPPIGDNCASPENGCQDKSLTFSSYLFWSCC